MFKIKSVLLVGLCASIFALGLANCDQFFSSIVGPSDTSVTLHADKNGHFFGRLTINGASLQYIVDSGASNVTLNSNDAQKANIDYTKGTLVSLLTPNGEVQAFSLKLDGLVVGQAILNDVETTVIEGESPPYVLLGISAQRKLDLKRDNAVMRLGRKR